MAETWRSIVDEFALPHLNECLERAAEQKQELRVDGIAVFEQNEHNWMIAGTVVNAMSCRLATQHPNLRETDSFERHLAAMRDMIAFTEPMHLQTWGIAFYLEGLFRLHRYRLLERVMDRETLERLQRKLDCHSFVDARKQALLPNYPSNYYGVAFMIAKYRERLGWGNADCGSGLFLDRLTEHIRKCSGERLYMDDSDGRGRYDRYTLVIAGEMCMRFADISEPVPELYRAMLRKASEIVMQMANTRGNGISYGRSLGAHGDTAVLEVLPIAASLGLLSDEEMRVAHGYSLKVAQKYRRFWIDPDTGLVNMWDKGRKIDPYRGKERLLNEDLDMCLKLIKAGEYWSKLGLGGAASSSDYDQQLERMDKFTYFAFEEGTYSRGLAVVRDRHHVIQLPLIGGHYQETPYLPIPSENRMLMTSPKTKQPALAPVVVLRDGSRLMPVEYMRQIDHEQHPGEFHVRYRQDAVCLLGEGVEPRPDKRMRSETHYTFREGTIEREDRLYPQAGLDIAEIRLEAALFSERPERSGLKVTFDEGEVCEVEAFGFDVILLEDVRDNRDYHTPDGALLWKAEWRVRPQAQQTAGLPIRLGWRLRYR